MQFKHACPIIHGEVVAFKNPCGYVEVLVVVPVKIRGRRAHGIDGIIQSHIGRIVEEVAILRLLVVLVLETQSIPNEIQIQ